MRMKWSCFALMLAGSWLGKGAPAAAGDVSRSPEFLRGRLLYAQHCLICHMGTGLGQPGTYPPLAGSDFLLADRARAISVICDGLSGPIKVNGVEYNNSMPPIIINDQQVADVLTFVLNSWGSQAAPFTADEVAAVRRTARFKTYEELAAAASYRALPPAPAGFTLREVARLNEFPVRIAGSFDGSRLFVLSTDGKVLDVETMTGKTTQLLEAADYADLSLGSPQTLGLTVGPDQHLYLTSNQRHEAVTPVMNEVRIFRSAETIATLPPKMNVWFATNYPFGIGPYNHGVSHLAFGPDGMVYVASGSRTDGNEPGTDPRYSKAGETPITAGLWRLDPATTPPTMKMHARGLRNVYGFAWDGDGRLFSVSNGPDAHSPEELDHVVAGAHYGFPYRFADWQTKPYPHTPEPPPGLEFKLPVANLGPAAGGSTDRPMFTFDPHSSPAGMVWLDERWPPAYQNSFLVTRFGNLLARDPDVGFDVLRVKLLPQPDGSWTAETHSMLAPLGRPIDIFIQRGALYIAEYTRPTDLKGGIGWLPGRIIELKPSGAGLRAFE
ncbi:MAG TPA: copper oxidase [Verrucomicrobiales bacterium]|nr:copper oxidase [Verrucomicrobiales bacterium]